MQDWSGAGEDHELEDTVDFLEMLAFSRLPDVRKVVSLYKDKAFPRSFDLMQEADHEKQRIAQEKSIQNRLGTFLFSMFARPATQSVEGTNSNGVKTYWEKKRERNLTREKEYTRIKALMQQQLEAEMKKEKEYYAQHKMSLMDLFQKGPPPPSPSA